MLSILQNLVLILELTLLYLPLVLGAYLALSLMQIPNLALESALLMGAITGSVVSNFLATHPPASLMAGLLVAAICGGLVGLATGLLHAYGKLSHLLSNIVVIGATYGLSLLCLGGSHLTLSNSVKPLQTLNFITGYPCLPLLAIIALILASSIYLFLKTQLGVSCAIYGDNSRFLVSHKISVPYVMCTGLTIANALAGTSGYLIAQNNGFVDTHMGVGLPLLCITALMLGKSILNSTRPIIFGLPIAGIMSYFVLQSILIQLGLDLRYFPLIQALVLTMIFLMQKSRHISVLGV